MGTTVEALAELHTLLKETKIEEAIRLCAVAFASSEKPIRELAELVATGELERIMYAVAGVLDAPLDKRQLAAMELGLLCQRVGDPRVLEKAKHLARLQP